MVIKQTFDGLEDLIVKEKFLAVSEDELALYLRERSPTGLDELVNLVDLFLKAHCKPTSGSKPFAKKEKPHENQSEKGSTK